MSWYRREFAHEVKCIHLRDIPTILETPTILSPENEGKKNVCMQVIKPVYVLYEGSRYLKTR